MPTNGSTNSKRASDAEEVECQTDPQATTEIKSTRDLMRAGADAIRAIFNKEPGTSEHARELCREGNKRLKEIEESRR